MTDNFKFSNGQALGTLNSTGVVSTNIWDLEEDVSVDQQVLGWINGIILSSTNTGNTQGMDIELRTSDNTNMSTTPLYLGGIHLTLEETITGHRFCFGVCKANLEKYLGIWYKATNTSLDGATSVDCWFSEQPVAILGIQKKNASAGAS